MTIARAHTAAVEIDDLDISYGGTRVLTRVNLAVQPSSVAAVLGPSGSGKTSLLRAIVGFVTPTAGSIRLSGREVFGPDVNVAPERRNIGLVPQEGALFPHLDVAGNIGFGLARRTHAQRQAAQARISELIELVSLSGHEHTRPCELSGGMQQRVALARALARSPGTVLLDEPFSALDAGLRRELRMHVRELLLKTGTGVILVTHDVDEAEAMADEIYSISGPAPHRIAKRARSGSC